MRCSSRKAKTCGHSSANSFETGWSSTPPIITRRLYERRRAASQLQEGHCPSWTSPSQLLDSLPGITETKFGGRSHARLSRGAWGWLFATVPALFDLDPARVIEFLALQRLHENSNFIKPLMTTLRQCVVFDALNVQLASAARLHVDAIRL